MTATTLFKTIFVPAAAAEVVDEVDDAKGDQKRQCFEDAQYHTEGCKKWLGCDAFFVDVGTAYSGKTEQAGKNCK